MNKKRIAGLLTVLGSLCCALGLVACGGKDTHTHTFSDVWSSDATYHWHAATCGHDEVADKAEHSFSAGVCSVCKAQAPAVPGTEGLQYTLSADGTYYICNGIGTATATAVVVANTYNDLPVRAIADEAFGENETIRSVTIQPNVRTVGASAFAFCENLTAVSLGGGIETIGASAFAATGLTAVTIPDSVKRVGEGAFQSCEDLTTVTFGNGATVIEAAAFAYDPKLATVSLGKVVSIGENAFRCIVDNPNTAMTSLTIPETAYHIGANAFTYCNGLTSITFAHVDGWFPQTRTVDDQEVGPEGWSASVLSDPSAAANYLKVTYKDNNWANTEVYLATTVAVASVSLNKTAATLRVGGSETLTATVAPADATVTAVTWTSSDESVATVSDDGTVTGVSDGSATITAAVGGKSAACTVTVTSFTYEPTADGAAYALVGFAGGAATKVSVPAEYLGKPVTEIREGAFDGCNALEEISVADSVTKIAQAAFRDCTALQKITLPFVGAEKDGEQNHHFGYVFGTDGSNANTVPGTLTEVVITGGTLLDNNAFKDCRNIRKVTIPDSVAEIRIGAFAGCTSLADLTLPFVGRVASNKNDENQYPLGYLFGTQSVSGIARTEQVFHNVSSTKTETYYIPYSLKHVTVTGGNILYGAFSNCTMLTGVTVGDGVGYVQESAFSGCNQLEDLAIGDVTEIAAGALVSCPALVNLTIPFVGSEPFSAAVGSKSLFGYIFASQSYTSGADKYESTTQSAHNDAEDTTFSNTFYIPVSLRQVTVTGGKILYGAFSACNHLTKITLPEGTDSIGSLAFSNCAALTEIAGIDTAATVGGRAVDGTAWFAAKPDGLVYVGTAAYGYKGDMPADTAIALRAGTTCVSGYAFYACANLKSISMPESVVYIGECAFLDCTALTNVTFGDDVTTVNADAFYNTAWYDAQPVGPLYIGKVLYKYVGQVPSAASVVTVRDGTVAITAKAFENRSALTGITIPDSVTAIGTDAFRYCDAIKTATVPAFAWKLLKDSKSSLQSATITSGEITSGMFQGYSQLTSITFGDGVTAIGSNACTNLRNLDTVVIGSNVTRIDSGAFDYCRSLTSVYYKGTAEEYAAIDIRTTSNDTLRSAIKYYYSETQPTGSGRYWHYDTDGVTIRVW